MDLPINWNKMSPTLIKFCLEGKKPGYGQDLDVKTIERILAGRAKSQSEQYINSLYTFFPGNTALNEISKKIGAPGFQNMLSCVNKHA